MAIVPRILSGKDYDVPDEYEVEWGKAYVVEVERMKSEREEEMQGALSARLKEVEGAREEVREKAVSAKGKAKDGVKEGGAASSGGKGEMGRKEVEREISMGSRKEVEREISMGSIVAGRVSTQNSSLSTQNSGLSNSNQNPPLSNLSTPRPYNPIIQALLYGILVEPAVSAKYFKVLCKLVEEEKQKDRWNDILKLLKKLVKERWPRLLEPVKTQVMWMVTSMVRIGVVGVEAVVVELIRQVPSGSAGNATSGSSRPSPSNQSSSARGAAAEGARGGTIVSNQSSSLLPTSNQPSHLASHQGSMTISSIWLWSELLTLFSGHRLWLYSIASLLPIIAYSIASLIPDHHRSEFDALREREVALLVQLVRERFDALRSAGRDFIRVLYNISLIPEIKSIWEQVIMAPSEGPGSISNLKVFLSTPSSKDVLTCRLTPEMETWLSFVFTQVKSGPHGWYQKWFQSKFLSTADSEPLVTDMIRWIVSVHHPTNAILQSSILPRYKWIGWLIGACTRSPHFQNNARQALFYDWYFYNPSKDNIMNIEPGALLLMNTLQKDPAFVQALSEHLMVSCDNYLVPILPSLRDDMRRSVHMASRLMLEKKVISSFDPLFSFSHLNQNLRDHLRKVFEAGGGGGGGAGGSSSAVKSSSGVLGSGGSSGSFGSHGSLPSSGSSGSHGLLQSSGISPSGGLSSSQTNVNQPPPSSAPSAPGLLSSSSPSPPTSSLTSSGGVSTSNTSPTSSLSKSHSTHSTSSNGKMEGIMMTTTVEGGGVEPQHSPSHPDLSSHTPPLSKSSSDSSSDTEGRKVVNIPANQSNPFQSPDSALVSHPSHSNPPSHPSHSNPPSHPSHSNPSSHPSSSDPNQKSGSDSFGSLFAGWKAALSSSQGSDQTMMGSEGGGGGGGGGVGIGVGIGAGVGVVTGIGLGEDVGGMSSPHSSQSPSQSSQSPSQPPSSLLPSFERQNSAGNATNLPSQNLQTESPSASPSASPRPSSSTPSNHPSGATTPISTSSSSGTVMMEVDDIRHSQEIVLSVSASAKYLEPLVVLSKRIEAGNVRLAKKELEQLISLAASEWNKKRFSATEMSDLAAKLLEVLANELMEQWYGEGQRKLALPLPGNYVHTQLFGYAEEESGKEEEEAFTMVLMEVMRGKDLSFGSRFLCFLLASFQPTSTVDVTSISGDVDQDELFSALMQSEEEKGRLEEREGESLTMPKWVSPYLRFVKAISKSSGGLKTAQEVFLEDMTQLAVANVFAFNSMVPLVCRYLPDYCLGSSVFVHLVLRTCLPVSMTALHGALSSQTFRLVGPNLTQILQDSLKWESYAQQLLWNLLTSEFLTQTEPLIEALAALLPAFHTATTSEAMQGSLTLISLIGPVPKLIHAVLAMPITTYEFSTAILVRWMVEDEFHNELAKKLPSLLSSLSKHTPSLRRALMHLSLVYSAIPSDMDLLFDHSPLRRALLSHLKSSCSHPSFSSLKHACLEREDKLLAAETKRGSKKRLHDDDHHLPDSDSSPPPPPTPSSSKSSSVAPPKSKRKRAE